MFIRDYGRHDLAQLRIKKNRLLDPALPGLYIRGDGTRVYFFKMREIENLLKASPRSIGSGPDEASRAAESGNAEEQGGIKSMFEILQSDEDRRMVSPHSFHQTHP